MIEKAYQCQRCGDPDILWSCQGFVADRHHIRSSGNLSFKELVKLDCADAAPFVIVKAVLCEECKLLLSHMTIDKIPSSIIEK